MPCHGKDVGRMRNIVADDRLLTVLARYTVHGRTSVTHPVNIMPFAQMQNRLKIFIIKYSYRYSHY